MTKRRLVAFAGSLLVLLLTAASCPPQPVNGGGSANTTNTLILIDGSLPLAVALAIQQDPQSEPYFKEAAAAIDLASATNATYAQVQAVIESEGWTNQVAEFAVLDALKLWQAWGGQTGWTNSADSQLILQHIAADIRLGLPPATPNSIRGFADQARKQAKDGKHAKNGSYAPIAHVAHAVTAPFKDPTPPTFGNEIAIGFGGSYTVPQKPDVAPWKQPFNHGTYGLSLQTIYWLNPYFGTGAEANIDDVTRLEQACSRRAVPRSTCAIRSGPSRRMAFWLRTGTGKAALGIPRPGWAWRGGLPGRSNGSWTPATSGIRERRIMRSSCARASTSSRSSHEHADSVIARRGSGPPAVAWSPGAQSAPR